jgi:hypothetical protein
MLSATTRDALSNIGPQAAMRSGNYTFLKPSNLNLLSFVGPRVHYTQIPKTRHDLKITRIRKKKNAAKHN